jgi:hypothetical protein
MWEYNLCVACIVCEYPRFGGNIILLTILFGTLLHPCSSYIYDYSRSYMFLISHPVRRFNMGQRDGIYKLCTISTEDTCAMGATKVVHG